MKSQKNRQIVLSFQAFLLKKQIQITVQYLISWLLEKINNLLEKFMSIYVIEDKSAAYMYDKKLQKSL